MTTDIAFAENRLRQAVSTGCLEDIDLLAALYSEAFRAWMAEPGANDEVRKEGFQRFLRTLAWASQMVRIDRAFISRQLSIARQTQGYLSALRQDQLTPA